MSLFSYIFTYICFICATVRYTWSLCKLFSLSNLKKGKQTLQRYRWQLDNNSTILIYIYINSFIGFRCPGAIKGIVHESPKNSYSYVLFFKVFLEFEFFGEDIQGLNSIFTVLMRQ